MEALKLILEHPVAFCFCAVFASIFVWCVIEAIGRFLVYNNPPPPDDEDGEDDE